MKNCFKNCSNYHYFDINFNKYYCTPYLNCSGFYNKLIPDKNECIDNCIKDNEYKYKYENKCYKQCPNNTLNLNFYYMPRRKNILTFNNEEFFDTKEMSEYLSYGENFFWSTEISNTDTYENEIIIDSSMRHKSSYIGETYEEIIDETKLGDTIINEDKKSTDLIIEENEYKNIVTYEFFSDTLNIEKIQTETAKLFTNDKASNIEESYDIIIDDSKLSDSLINTNKLKDKISTDFIIEDNSDRNKRTNEKSDKYQTELM